MAHHVALIAGVSGAVGSALARELSSKAEWSVYGIARRAPTTPLTGVTYLQVDMNDRDQCLASLASLTDVTHLFYCGRATHAEQVLESAEDNLRLLRHLLNSVEAAATDLQHVHLVQGGKYYGVHVGPFPTPAREQDSRAPIPNFNYDQQDFLQQRAQSANWHWSASRPNTLLHFSPAIARNLVSSLGAYALICRELGAALDFPGPQGAFASITQFTSLDLLARGIAWMVTEPACGNQAFNLTNTDVIRWHTLWPKLAQAFNMPLGSVRPLRLADVMSERGELWQQICQYYQLQATGLDQVANWSYVDATLERYWDEILCHNKARQFGFHDWDNSENKFFSVLQQYRDARILPAAST